MKHLFTLKTIMLACLLFVGMGAWGADVVYKTAKFGTQASSGTSTGYTGTFTSVTNGFSVSVDNGNTNGAVWDCVKFGRKGSTSVGAITTSAAIDKAVTKVVLTLDAITATNVNSIKLYTGSTENACTTEVGTFSSATGDQTVNISNPAVNKFYKISIDCKSGSGNGFVAVSKVVYYYNDEAGDDSGDGDDDSDGTLTINMSKLTNPNTTSTITYGTYNWTSGTVSGIYNGASSSGNTSFQFNYSSTGSSNYRDKQAVYNTVAVPGRITSIKMVTASGTNRTWRPYVSSSAITPANYTSATALTATVVNSSEGTTWEVTGNNRYFYLNYTTGSASYIGDIVITYETSPAGDPQITNFVKTANLNLETGAAPYDVRDALNIPNDYDQNTYTITTTIDGLTEKDGEYACAYPYLSFQKAGTYTVNVTAPAMPGKYAETSGTINVIVEEPFVVAAGTYTIDLNKETYGVSAGNNATEQSAVKKGVTVVSGCNPNAGTKTYYSDTHIRYYVGSYLKLSAPTGYAITGVVFSEPSADVDKKWDTVDGTEIKTVFGTYSSKAWAGSASQINFAFDKQCRVASIEVTYAALPATTNVTIGSAGYATFVAPYNMDFSGSTITAYLVNPDVEHNVVHMTSVGKVPAGTALVVKGTSASVPTTSSADPVTTALEVSSSIVTYDAGNNVDYYYLGQENNQVGFRPLGSGSIAAGKCFFKVAKSGPARFMRIATEGETTGIKAIESAKNNAVVYNLAGQRVAANAKGIVIVNGKKMLNK